MMHAAEAGLPASAVRVDGASCALGVSPVVSSDWIALSGAPAFQRVLQLRPVAKTAHFAVHCLREAELSTGGGASTVAPVDERPVRYVRARPLFPRLGLVVPKRQARRAVTRNLVKRQVRAAWEGWWLGAACQGTLACTDWVVRLRAPIDRKLFVSGRSDALAAVLRAELQGLFESAARRVVANVPVGGSSAQPGAAA